MIQSAQNGRSLSGWIPWTILLLSVVGLADATYLSAKHFLGEIPTCVLFSGCEVVTTSKYSLIGPIPVSALGVLFYFLAIILIVNFIDKRGVWAIKYLAFLSIPAFIFSIYLVFLQAFILDAWCIYCVTSAISSTLIFFLSHYAKKKIGTHDPISVEG